MGSRQERALSCRTCALQLRCMWNGCPSYQKNVELYIGSICGLERAILVQSKICRIHCLYFVCPGCSRGMPIYGKNSIEERKKFMRQRWRIECRET